jgi:3'-phosphoadenosine 5'-phosphosulfate (PAPS) 3'-phosphatase
MWVVGSMNTNQASMNEIHHALDPQHVARVAGAGNKIVHMLDQKADFYVNLVPGFKYWDLCAGEALLQSMMGVVCDASNKPLVYDENAEDFTIQEGIVISKNKKVFEIAQERLFDATGNDMMHYHARTHEEVAEYRRQKAAKLAA